MLDTAEIRFFQSLEHIVLEFSPGLNVIKGTSHGGKSAIIRALRKLFFNKPSGEGFKSHFAEKKDYWDIAASFTNGEWIALTKDPENRYYSDNLNLKALKTDVPDEVKAITQISEINFQSQGDKFFLVGDTPGQAGKKLNEIIGLQIIDENRTKINQKITKVSTELEIVKTDLTSTETNLLKYKHLKKAERLVTRIDFLISNKEAKTKRKAKLIGMLLAINTHQKNITDLKNWLVIKNDFKELQKNSNKLWELKQRRIKLFAISIQISQQTKIIKQAKIISDLKPWYKILKGNSDKIKTDVLRRDKIQGILLSLSQLKKRRGILSRAVEADKKQKKKLEAQLNFCQTCGAKKEHWRKI
ncbi:MAG TPA: hypothetical protein VMZ91_16100 [Candidatus Paceibacterota bacterium]|nr:hypothetical protein [Candidatus Paceibacterota bacterium]